MLPAAAQKHERTTKLNKNIIGMLVIKAVGIAVSVMYVPLLISVLNTRDYGVWLTIASLVAWIGLFDVGLGNGLRNKLASAVAGDEHVLAREYVSTAYAGIVALCLILASAYMLISPIIDWSRVLNTPRSTGDDLQILLGLVILLSLLQLSISTINSILLALQLPAVPLLITMLGQLLSFLAISLLYAFNYKITLLSVGLTCSIFPVLTLVVATVSLFTNSLKQYRPSIGSIRLEHLETILGVGAKFFFLQVVTIMTYQTGSIIIAHTVGPEAVTEYNLASKYIGLISVLFTVVVTPYWSASTDAYVKNDLAWIRASVKRLNRIWILVSLLGAILIACANPVYRMWTGGKVEAEWLILSLTLVYFLLQMRYATYGYILNGIGKIKLQLIVTPITAVVFLPLAYFASKGFGIPGLLGAMILVGAVNSLWSAIQFHRVVTGKASGVWNE